MRYRVNQTIVLPGGVQLPYASEVEGKDVPADLLTTFTEKGYLVPISQEKKAAAKE